MVPGALDLLRWMLWPCEKAPMLNWWPPWNPLTFIKPCGVTLWQSSPLWVQSRVGCKFRARWRWVWRGANHTTSSIFTLLSPTLTKLAAWGLCMIGSSRAPCHTSVARRAVARLCRGNWMQRIIMCRLLNTGQCCVTPIIPGSRISWRRGIPSWPFGAFTNLQTTLPLRNSWGVGCEVFGITLLRFPLCRSSSSSGVKPQCGRSWTFAWPFSENLLAHFRKSPLGFSSSRKASAWSHASPF